METGTYQDIDKGKIKSALNAEQIFSAYQAARKEALQFRASLFWKKQAITLI